VNDYLSSLVASALSQSARLRPRPISVHEAGPQEVPDAERWPTPQRRVVDQETPLSRDAENHVPEHAPAPARERGSEVGVAEEIPDASRVPLARSVPRAQPNTIASSETPIPAATQESWRQPYSPPFIEVPNKQRSQHAQRAKSLQAPPHPPLDSPPSIPTLRARRAISSFDVQPQQTAENIAREGAIVKERTASAPAEGERRESVNTPPARNHRVQIPAPRAKARAREQVSRVPMPDRAELSPVVQISIGRIEVKAVTPQKGTAAAPKGSETRAMSLDEYLVRRREGDRQ
jgi:hypothetical protein